MSYLFHKWMMMYLYFENVKKIWFIFCPDTYTYGWLRVIELLSRTFEIYSDHRTKFQVEIMGGSYLILHPTWGLFLRRKISLQDHTFLSTQHLASENPKNEKFWYQYVMSSRFKREIKIEWTNAKQ